MKLPIPEEITRSLEEMLRPRRPKGQPPRPPREKTPKAQKPPREKRLRQIERKPGSKKNFLSRLITGLGLAGLTILLIVIHPHAFAFEVMFFVAIGIKEICDLAAHNGVNPSFWVAMPCSMAIVIAASWAPQLMGPVLALSMIATMVTMTFRKKPPATPNATGFRSTRYLDAMATVYAFMYVGWLFSFCLQIRMLPGKVPGPNGSMVDAGAAYLLMLVATTAWSDVGAYAFGRAFGRHALAPSISPGKTIEGGAGGMLVSALSGLAFGWWLQLPLALCALLGVLLSASAQLGDLWESLMKREAGIKDSGRALAGHGGVLDRFDSMFYAMPVGYLFLTYILL